jgi:hypothetical protein
MSSSALHGFHVVGVTYRTAPVGVRERLVQTGEAPGVHERGRSGGGLRGDV